MMERGLGELISSQRPSPSSSSSNNNNSDAENFECNICFDLAQDPIVTLRGHLFCWPYLYKWLHVYSRSRECPVCKALIEKEKLVPLYGRGKNSTDPRSKPIPETVNCMDFGIGMPPCLELEQLLFLAISVLMCSMMGMLMDFLGSQVYNNR